MKKWRLLAVGLCLLLAGCQYMSYEEKTNDPENTPNDAVVEVLPRPEDVTGEVAPIVGEPLSPDRKWEVRQIGAHEGVTADGTYAPEAVQIVDAATEKVMWEGIADHRQAVLWSPDSKYLAMSRTARGYGYITVIETENWGEWDLIPPEGSNIPKHTFLPEIDWGEWTAEDQIRLTIGRDGNIGPQTSYRCLMEREEDGLAATVLEQTTEVLSEEYDFDHDGISETTELVTIFDSTGTGQIGWLELCVKNQNDECLWKSEAGTAHVGWNSIFALTIDGQDYLLRYIPYIGMGFGDYHYWLFSLGENGEEMYEERAIEFDLNFYSQNHQGFDSESLGRFLTDVHAYLDESELLLTTEKGVLRTGGSGAEFREDIPFWNESCPYDESLSVTENLEIFASYQKQSQRIGEDTTP